MWQDIAQRAMREHPQDRLILLDHYDAPGVLKIAQSDDRSGAQVALRNLIGFFLGLRNAMCPEDRLAFEARRLQELAARGLSVPSVLARGKNWVVMEKLDASWLDTFNALLPQQQLDRLTQSFTELGKLHSSAEWHGGAQLRNLMWHQGKTYRIDFEETTLLSLALSSRQRFDLLILLVDVIRHCPKTQPLAQSLPRFLQAYQEAGGQKEHSHFLQRWARLTFWLTLPLHPLRRVLGRDGRMVLDFLSAMRKLEKLDLPTSHSRTAFLRNN